MYPLLIEREKQILRIKRNHLSWTYAQIGKHLGVSTSTVNNAMTSIFKKMETRNIMTVLERAKNQL